MRNSVLLTLTLLVGGASASFAQISIPAPAGWKTQARAGGATTFTPPDLQRGEVYSVTLYDSAPLDGKTLEEFLSAFAGKVGKGAGQLDAPLKIKTQQGRTVTGVGAYNGPQGTQLLVVFEGVSLDGGKNIHVERTLLSTQNGLIDRYRGAKETLSIALVKRAVAETGDNIASTPPAVLQKLKTVGGQLVPGVYAGNQFRGQELFNRFRIYLYANGEYRMCDQNDEDIKERFFDEHVGNISYNRNSGQLNIDWSWGLGSHSEGDFCYYGRDARGKPAIYAEEDTGFSTKRTTLTWVGPPTKRPSKSQVEEAKAAQEAERNRFKWVVAPGKGVSNVQIATVLLDSKFNGQSADETVYLLLKNGSVYADLPVPPDELDVLKSKQKEPDKWGKWRKVAGGYKVSWAGGPYQNLPGSAVLPAPAQQKLQGRWGTGSSSGIIGMSSSYALWGVSFGKNGRFKKDSRGGSSSSIGFGSDATHVNSSYDDEGSFGGASGANFAVSSQQKKKNPNGSREGDYSINGYVLTLRFDNGKIKRLPFFFGDKTHETIWFEGASMSKNDEKK